MDGNSHRPAPLVDPKTSDMIEQATYIYKEGLGPHEAP